MQLYSVSEVARLSGVSVRTLHHYHEIGLLQPATIRANGYRYYGELELLRLQQILFHREIGLPLAEIGRVLDAPDFDRTEALKAHRRRLAAQASRCRELMRTIDETLAALEGAKTMDHERIYRGFDMEKAQEAEAEAWLRQRYGGWVQERIDRSNAINSGWSDAEREAYFREGREFDAAVADAIARGLNITSDPVQALVRDHCATVFRGWGAEASVGACRTLAEIYRAMPQFQARFEQIGPSAADFVASAIEAYAERELA